MRRLRVGLAQIDTTVGDLAGNAAKIVAWTARARDAGVDLVAFPELAVTGYPPEDLLLRRSFVEDNLAALDTIAAATTGIVAVVGFVDEAGDVLYNAAAVLADGRIRARYYKRLLPNYGVFDEDRYFQPGAELPVYTIAGVRVGVNICEDIWYPDGPTRDQALRGAEVVININASPYHRGKGAYRETMISTRASDSTVVVCYVNAVGGQDELVFDGHSLICDERGALVARGAQFAQDLIMYDVNVEAVAEARVRDARYRKERASQTQLTPAAITISTAPYGDTKPAIGGHLAAPLDANAEVWQALVLGVRDYIAKTGFESVLVALSGGIDSSIVAAIAVDALGADHVIGLSMPSRFSSDGSKTDAQELADRLGIRMLTIPIEGVFAASLDALSDAFADTQFGLAEENLQARIRGNIQMSLSNKFGWMVLTTGNKSEMATGYATLYGDMAGGFAVIKDVFKTLVFELSRYRNRVAGHDIIPQAVIDKPPSAELRPDQLDTDSLPPYEVLDPILQAYVEDDRSIDEIVAMGFDAEFVARVVTMVDRNEYKRRQSPPGVKITPRAFGRDRRLPIANRYRPR